MNDKTINRRGLLKKVAWGAGAAAGVGALGSEAYLLLKRRSMDDLYGPYPDSSVLQPLRLADAKAEKPNVIIIYTDDLGYGDLGCYGSKAIRTPHIDRLAKTGMRFTDYYACSGVCSPSRAGLLTGRYPFRSGMTGNPYPADEALGRVLVRNLGGQMAALGSMDLHEGYATSGLADKEISIATGLKVAGYRTAMVGKWHLGDFGKQPEFHPRKFGFDTYYGVPHASGMRPCPLYRNETKLKDDILDVLGDLTGLYTTEAVQFIEHAKGQPFFLYLAHTFPHQPLAASANFAGKSKGGRYGDTVEEIDWSVGQIVDALDRAGVSDNTLIIFTSDNGPWFEGSAGNLRGGKGQSMDGGFKVPCIAKWPKRIKAGSESCELVTNLDIFPTLFHLAGVAPPSDRVIDGKDISGILNASAPKSPTDAFFYYHYDELQAVRVGSWKYIRKTNLYIWPIPLDAEALPSKFGANQLGSDRLPLLYDLTLDPGEKYNVLAAYPDVAAKLEQLMTTWEAQNKKNPRGFVALAA